MARQILEVNQKPIHFARSHSRENELAYFARKLLVDSKRKKEKEKNVYLLKKFLTIYHHRNEAIIEIKTRTVSL